jgi:excisionase family DNA binding protein
MSNASDGDILTTFQAARLCGVSHKSIERWIDAGFLRGFRTPGGHRRVHRADLLEFIQKRRTTDRAADAPAAVGSIEAARVLVVDDEATIRDLFTEYFKTVGQGKYVLEVAASGYEAGVQVERFNPHIVLLDLMMDDLDGFEVCRKLRNDPAHAATIVVAVTGSAEAAQQAESSGMFHRVVLKPIKMASVKDVIDHLLAEQGFVKEAFVGV